TNGAVQIFVDGASVETVTGVATGHTIDIGGTIVLGQDQDSVGGGFASDQVFSGALYDVRIWNDTRTSTEIAENYQQKFDSGSLPAGLIVNWQMDGFNGSNEVVDVVSGNNLSVGHASGAGFVASTPVDDLHVIENATNGTSVGYVLPSDPDVDVTQNFTFSLLDDANGRFAINSSTGEITVADGTQ
ncbi:MAG: hypothetical protein KDA83_22460, partial [Planctomycetales bacterium]|nr:hypothetical protein [Planctomycetales bacterium]